MRTAIIKAGWGYCEEYMGNLRGDFKRADSPVPVTILETRRNGQDVIVRLPNGKRGLADSQSLESQEG